MTDKDKTGRQGREPVDSDCLEAFDYVYAYINNELTDADEIARIDTAVATRPRRTVIEDEHGNRRSPGIDQRIPAGVGPPGRGKVENVIVARSDRLRARCVHHVGSPARHVAEPLVGLELLPAGKGQGRDEADDPDGDHQFDDSEAAALSPSSAHPRLRAQVGACRSGQDHSKPRAIAGNRMKRRDP